MRSDGSITFNICQDSKSKSEPKESLLRSQTKTQKVLQRHNLRSSPNYRRLKRQKKRKRQIKRLARHQHLKRSQSKHRKLMINLKQKRNLNSSSSKSSLQKKQKRLPKFLTSASSIYVSVKSPTYGSILIVKNFTVKKLTFAEVKFARLHQVSSSL